MKKRISKNRFLFSTYWPLSYRQATKWGMFIPKVLELERLHRAYKWSAISQSEIEEECYLRKQ